jgi:hypothetical protein
MLLMTQCQYLALKGPHVIAQGKALGHAAKHMLSPEGAKSGSVHWTALAAQKSSRAMPPFQGWNRVGIGFPGLRPGLSHSAPSGPNIERLLDSMPLRDSWAFRDGFTVLSPARAIDWSLRK